MGAAGEVYATKTGSTGCHVQVLDARGQRVYRFGEAGAGVLYTGIAVTSRGRVWVSRLEHDAGALVEFDTGGEPLRTIPVTGLRFGCPATDAHDRLYVPCERSRDVKVLAPDGALLHRFGRCGVAPCAVAVAMGGRIGVAGTVV